MIRTHLRVAWRLWLLVFLATVLSGVAQASGPGGGGGGGGGNGGGGGGGGHPVVTTTTQLTLSNFTGPFNGATPQGTATLVYTSSSALSVNLQFSNVNLPDGTIVDVTFNILSLLQHQLVTGTYDYPIAITNGQGSLSLSLANGQGVPFLPPTIGSTGIGVTYYPNRATIVGSVELLEASFGGAGSGG
jgi:hypothetical protein